MKIAVVIPVGAGRQRNLEDVLRCLAVQTRQPDLIVVHIDGQDAMPSFSLPDTGQPVHAYTHAKHEPGLEQPRNVATRVAVQQRPDLTHVVFLDSDILVGPTWLNELEFALLLGPRNRVIAAPYDWMAPGEREPQPDLRNDPRWEMIDQSPPTRVYRSDLAAGLACFSGNLMWPIEEFARVGGYWNELHHGRCEDGELGLRAVAMGVPISFAAKARGWHMWHPINMERTLACNARDVPMLNARHPWVERGDLVVVEEDGRRFDVLCPGCGESVNTNLWWSHAPACGTATELPV